MRIQRFLIAQDFINTFIESGIKVPYVFLFNNDNESGMIMNFEKSLDDEGFEYNKYIIFAEKEYEVNQYMSEYELHVELCNDLDIEYYEEIDILITKVYDELCKKHDLKVEYNTNLN